jgi:amino acid adenylation domain-containing protein
MLNNLKNSIIVHENANAFHINNSFYSYKQLSENISIIQKLLKSEKKDSNIVGIVTNDDIETYASILAIWFSGLSYVPISSKTPKERNSNIISQAEIQTILSSSAQISNFIDIEKVNIIYTNNQKSSNSEIEIIDTQKDDLSYTLFTSGSTGIPKGVPISRKNVEAFVESFFALNYNFDKSDRFLQMFELTFDVSVACTLIPLLVGACVYTVPSDEVKYTYIYKLLENHKITVATLVPSVLAYLKPYFEEINLPDLKYCILTAEASYHKILTDWQKCIPNAEIWNLYGPTEATVWCLSYKWENTNDINKQYNGLIPIGSSMKNVDAIIIDEIKKIVQKGEKGELCVSGNHITKGYLKNEKRNKEVFFIIDEKRFYKTGDLSFENIYGDIMYCGRIDNQVQIQGFRVELGEIEHHTRNFTKIANVAAIAVTNEFENTEIHLYVENYIENTKIIYEYLKTKIPTYMLPSAIISLQSFPVNASNKIDRIALKKLIKN